MNVPDGLIHFIGLLGISIMGASSQFEQWWGDSVILFSSKIVFAVFWFGAPRGVVFLSWASTGIHAAVKSG